MNEASESRDRAPLSRERVLTCAVAIADAGGLESLTMRSLAKELDVRPMSLYHYFATKDEILDGIVDLVFGEIELPAADGDWRTEVGRRATSARSVLRRHSWAIALMESRTTPGPATLRHHEAMLDTLRSAGLSLPMTGHAYALLDSFVYGFAIQESALPFDRDTAPEVTQAIAAQFSSSEYPRLREYAVERVMKPGYDFGDEFTYGLGVILDDIERSIPGADPGAERGE